MLSNSFREMAVDLLNTVLQQSKAMRMLRKASAKGQQPSSQGGQLTDDDKIAMQLNMDIEEYGRILSEEFQINTSTFEPFTNLKQSINKLFLEREA